MDDIATLSRATGINVRTIRYYLAQGLLPPPQGRGPAAVYGQGHHDRLLLIRRLQDAHLPLAAIRAHLEALDDDAVAEALEDAEAEAAAHDRPVGEMMAAMRMAEAPPPSERVRETAADYVRAVLAAPPTEQAAAVGRAITTARALGSTKPPTRSNWERIAIHPDVELHVRRPLARSDQRRIDALLDAARRLFDADHP